MYIFFRINSDRCKASLAIVFALLSFLLCATTLYPEKVYAAKALSESEIAQSLKQEEKRAKERRESLIRLTEEERKLNTDMAKAEDRILALESNLKTQQERLGGLAESGQSLQKDFEALSKERGRTELALAEVLKTLWELHSKRLGVNGRDLPDWHVTDREYTWSNELFKSLDGYRKTLGEQEVELGKLVHKRELVAHDISTQLSSIDKEKEKLLAERIRYNQRLSSLRKEKQDTEVELSSTLELISSLNFSLKAATERGDVAKGKGNLPWPVDGKIALSYKPEGNPPVRGLGFSSSSGAEVRAVHWGKVMFNDTMRGLGQVVVLQHGDSYFTVYAFLSETLVKQGQEVNRLQPLGKTGFYPDLKGPGLYFELRFHQKAINPEAWFGKNN